MLLTHEKWFIPPPTNFYTSESFEYAGACRTYSHYNYLRPGLIVRLKRQRFETALKLVQKRFHHTSAIDLGCADGIFLPSLSHYFNHVAAIDSNPELTTIASKLVGVAGLSNVKILCTDGLSISEIRSELQTERYQVLFLLETLEHVGTAHNMYESKIAFLEDAFSLLDPRGVIIASVPVMVGLPFLFKYSLQSILRMHHERYNLKSLLRSGLLRKTDELEPGWDGGHRGFNHMKLERAVRKRFLIDGKRNLGFSVVYVIRRAVD